MAGIERLEVHSKSYIVRWVRVDEGNTLSWSVQPHKKSINFGIVKHPGSGATSILASNGEQVDAAHLHLSPDGKSTKSSKKDTSAQQLLTGKGFIPIKWHGKCEADKVSLGTYDVPPGQGGMYGLVFDNTFSKQTSKTATFVVLTYPTGVAPQTAHHLPNLQLPHAQSSQSSLGKLTSPRNEAGPSASVDSLHSQNARARATSTSARSDMMASQQTYHVGTLSKRRRKKGQGYARRFFSLDYSTCTLSYYYDRNSSALRGAIPLSLAAVAADQRRREISIDSGAEVWHLRAPNDKEFQDWARALEKASRVARGADSGPEPPKTGPNLIHQHSRPAQKADQAQDVEWQQIEALVSRVVGTRDALRRLTKEVAALPQPPATAQHLAPSSAITADDSYFPPTVEKKPFWRRKSSSQALTPMLQQTAQSSTAAPSSDSAATTRPMNSNRVSKHRSRTSMHGEQSIHDHCESLLSDLDSVVGEFTTLISNKRRRMAAPVSATGVASRLSIDSMSTDEFFDAQDNKSAVVKIEDSDDNSTHTRDESPSNDGCSTSSSENDEDPAGTHGTGHLHPSKPKSLAPLPIDQAVSRRTTVPAPTVQPPSLIAFVRKNVGKDLSTVSLPVSSNEPLSLLQKAAEQLEYAQLLDKATRQRSPTERLLYVTAFAVSQFSSGRAKERATRKPFNPLLGETYELVRTDKEMPGGFRLLVEKIQHRPVRLAMQADSAHWSYSQSPSPAQKFWGKSAELTTEGRIRVVLRLAEGGDEYYSWNIATMFLRNVVMGEKYVEPVGTMSVVNDSTGHKASVEFKSKGMFGGRSEEVQVVTHGPDGSDTGSGLTGTWTTGLRTVGPGKAASEEVWKVGNMVDNAAHTYGLTQFAATLNEITEIEKDKMAPTDTRRRPDQRFVEQGRLDEAEEWKLKLEEEQRARRREAEARGETYRPRWFVKAEGTADGDEVWKMRTGKDGYWEERARGSWSNVPVIFGEANE
ncbi:hypothetical protein CDD82_1857 [Ophiocordyceps australis]|uniref:PH domain-containing protein n=1 Tax=Ophiocordyceps australis TaxID=1399860 RepID=A0A2C5ZV61_9HYPO|nr:hypothetical protein CDD82_1857 [Ophiocordyceps australis]